MDLDALLRRQDGLVTREQALAAGVTPSALRHRLRPGGPWQTPLPGVYACFTGALTSRQSARAALLLGGHAAMLGGASAARAHGLRTARDDGRVHLLVPHAVHVATRGPVVVRRTLRLPRPLRVGGLPTAPLPRAVVDACRGLSRLADVRALVAEPVQRGLVHVVALERELQQGESAGSALVRRALGEVAAGVRSAPEAELRDLLRGSRLVGHALWNCRLFDADGRWLADPDAYLEDAGLAVESDSRAWHLSPDDWEATMARHGRMEAAGLHVLHLSPRQHRSAPEAALDLVERTYVAALRSGPPPGVRIVRRDRGAA